MLATEMQTKRRQAGFAKLLKDFEKKNAEEF
jgi:hypothetical protein